MKYIYWFITIIFFSLMIAVNYLSVSWVFTWLTTNNLKNKFPFDYMPPGIIFAISWGIIYTLIWIYLCSLIYRLYKDFNKNSKKEVIYFTIINILNSSWILFTSFEKYILAWIIIFILFITLIIFIQKFANSLYKKIAFWIYLWWITIASFTLTIAQFVYLYNNEIALLNIFWYGILAFNTIIVWIIFWKIKNLFAFFWSISAIIIIILKLNEIIK